MTLLSLSEDLVTIWLGNARSKLELFFHNRPLSGRATKIQATSDVSDREKQGERHEFSASFKFRSRSKIKHVKNLRNLLIFEKTLHTF